MADNVDERVVSVGRKDKIGHVVLDRWGLSVSRTALLLLTLRAAAHGCDRLGNSRVPPLTRGWL